MCVCVCVTECVSSELEMMDSLGSGGTERAITEGLHLERTHTHTLLHTHTFTHRHTSTQEQTHACACDRDLTASCYI